MTRSARWSAGMHSRWAPMASRWRTRRRFGRQARSTSGWRTRRWRPRSARTGPPSRPSCKTRIQMATEQRTYESAVERLEAIIRRLDSNEAGLRETLELVKEGRELIEFAAGELDAVGKGLEELKLDDLIARLEASAPDSASSRN